MEPVAIIVGAALAAGLTLATGGPLDAALAAAAVAALLGVGLFDDGAGREWDDVIRGQGEAQPVQDHADRFGTDGGEGE